MKKIITDIELLLYDIYCWALDNIQDLTHFTIRVIKIITLISLWNKDVSNYLEDKLQDLRNSIKALKKTLKEVI